MSSTHTHTSATNTLQRRGKQAVLALVAAACLGVTFAATAPPASAAPVCDRDVRTFEIKRGSTTVVKIRVAAYACVGWARNTSGGYSRVVTTARVNVTDEVVNSNGSKVWPAYRRVPPTVVRDSTGRFMVAGIHQYRGVYKYHNGWLTRQAYPEFRISINANTFTNTGTLENLVTISPTGGTWHLNNW